MNAYPDLLPVLAVGALYLARLAELQTHRKTEPGRICELLTLRVFLFLGTTMALGSVLEYWLSGQGLRWGWFLGGAACGLASIFLRRRAIASLGRVWSLHVEIREDHPLIQEGPFRFMRHPTYCSMILELLASALMCQAWIMVLVIPLGFLPVLALRLRIEEEALLDKFGDRYRDYQRRVPMLFPFKWPAAK